MGEVDVLIGQAQARLLPTGGAGKDCCDNLRVLSTKFGSGRVLGGSSCSIKTGGARLTAEALKYNNAIFTETEHADIRSHFTTIVTRGTKLPSYPEAEEMGIAYPHSDLCSPCTTRVAQSQEMSIEERNVSELIRQNVHVDAVNHKVNVTYPVIGDLSKFEDNRWQVEAIAVKLEKSLAKEKCTANSTRSIAIKISTKN